MNPSKKTWIAVILSLFVMPGFGHVYLGKKVKGYLISIAICLLILALFILFERELLHQASLLHDQQMILSSIFVLAKKSWLAHRAFFVGGVGLIGLVWMIAALDLLTKNSLNK